MNNDLLSSESIQMLISSVTRRGEAPLQEIEAERLLNAIARVQSNVPTGVARPLSSLNGQNGEAQ